MTQFIGFPAELVLLLFELGQLLCPPPTDEWAGSPLLQVIPKHLLDDVH